MDSLSELKRDISMGLQDEVNKQLVPGETIVISLSGSFGEALVVTDKRAIVAREQASGLDLTSNVYTHQLGHLRGAVVVPLGNGGYIEMNLQPPVANIETARVYFPSSEDDRFAAAADYLSNLPTQRETATPKATTAVAGETGICPECKAHVDDRAIFCTTCGAALKTICLSCGQASPVGSAYCLGCGREMIEFSPACPKCGARIMRWMQFCPECGSNQRPVCVGCGTQVMPDWKHCAGCGRLLGSNMMDPSMQRSAQRMVQGIKERESLQQPAAEADFETQAPAPANSAEGHNKRGTGLFESEDFDGAIAEFSAAAALDPNNSVYRCNLGMAYDESDRDDEALAEYQKALALDPNDLNALMSLGYIYSEKDEFDKSKESWDRILQIAPDSAEAQEVQQNLRHQGEL